MIFNLALNWDLQLHLPWILLSHGQINCALYIPGTFRIYCNYFSPQGIQSPLFAFPGNFKDFFKTYLQLPHIGVDRHLVSHVLTAFCSHPYNCISCIVRPFTSFRPYLVHWIVISCGQWPFSIDFESTVLVPSHHRGVIKKCKNCSMSFASLILLHPSISQ